MPAVVYPTITYQEFPERFIEVPEGKTEEGNQAIACESLWTAG